ncbi:U3 small nucleolar RNA-associated protein NOL7 [Anableps anableps]
MVKKQRGKSASLPKKAESEKVADEFNLALDSSGDEAPEEVTFEDSKAQAVESLKQALDTARREKELLKEKRRKRQEFFQEQKKKKLLSADVLEKIDSVPLKKQKQAEEEEEEGKTKRKLRKLPGVRNLKGSYTVSTVTDREAADFQRRAAEDFIQSRLYGPGSCRSSTNELLSLQNKRGPNKSAAVQFVKKDWACKQRAKAEKLKKRWLHKQQLPSS